MPFFDLHAMPAPPRTMLFCRRVVRLALADGATVCVVNDTLVNVGQLARAIWHNRRYYAAIETKARRAHERGVYARVPPMANAIVVPQDRLVAQLEAWCHRDTAAHAELEAFDMAGFLRRVRTLAVDHLRDALTEARAEVARLEADLAAVGA